MGDVVKKEKNGKFVGWYIRFLDVDGQRKQRASHQPTKALAKRFLLEIEARVARGVVGIPEPEPEVKELTLSEVCDQFLKNYNRPRIKDLARYKSETQTSLRRLLTTLGERPMTSIKQADVRKERDRLMATFAKNTVTHTLRALSTVYNWARREGVIRCDNPCVGVERSPMEHLLEYLGGKDRSEIPRLLNVARERAEGGSYDDRLLYAMVATALFTGLRKGELFGLRWQDLDLDTRRLTVSRSFRGTPKGGKERHLRLPSACVPILSSWRKLCPTTREGLVFPVMKHGKAQMGESRSMLGLPAALEQAGCHPLQRSWHALRHTFASHFVMSGGSILALQKILGHHDIKQTMTYAHLAPEFLGDEMDRIKF